jgi:hypothetical protein
VLEFSSSLTVGKTFFTDKSLGCTTAVEFEAIVFAQIALLLDIFPHLCLRLWHFILFFIYKKD